jgi:hypothetical protein
MEKQMQWKIIVASVILFGSGCTTSPENRGAGGVELSSKDEPVKWVDVGTLTSVVPDMESTRPPGRLQSAVLGETVFGCTRIETTEGVYVVGDKVGVVEIGEPVSVGYIASDQRPGRPSYLTLGGKRYQVVR